MMKEIHTINFMSKVLFVFFASVLFMFGSTVFAQDRYWAVGTAVPGGIQELTAFPNRQYKYTGRLIEGGSLTFRNMEVPKGISVRYIKPTFEDAYAVTLPRAIGLCHLRRMFTVSLST